VIGSFDTIEHARKSAVALSPRFAKEFDQPIEALRSYAEQFEQDGDDNWVARCANNLERTRDFKVGPVTSDELI
jgi:hypothetical protein